MADGLYLYGVLPKAEAGLAADGFGPVRLIDCGWCTALASEVALADWRGPAMEDAAELARRARLHFSVLQLALVVGTPVPLRFGTVVRAGHLGDFLAAGRSSIESGLEVARQGREWLVHLSPDPAEAEAEALEREPELRVLARRISQAGKGAGYLLAKERTRRVTEHAERMATRAHGALCQRLEPLAAARKALRPRGSDVARIAWLVSREQESGFVAAARRAAADASVGVRLVGPSPPYNFISAHADDGAHAA